MAESGGSTSHSSSSLSGGSGSEDQINWKERCHTLEASLHKFKSQAAKIRELLAQKMQELEQRTQEAERRAESAEEKNSELEEILRAAHVLPSQPELERKLGLVESQCREKDKSIVALTAQIEEQKRLRIQEAKLLEEKSLKIKDWVTKKIRDLELQNDQYRVEADTLRDQVEVLRARLHSLPTGTARQIHRRSVQDNESRPNSGDISPPEIPQRPSSSILETFRRERDLGEIPDLQKKSPRDISMDSSPEMEDPIVDNMADVSDDEDFEPLYQEIDDNHQSKYEPKRRAGPPQVRIERKIFPNPQMTSSMISSTNGSEEMLDRQPNSPLMQPRKQQQQQQQQLQNLYALPHQHKQNQNPTSAASSRSCQSPPTLQPRACKSPPQLQPRGRRSPPNLAPIRTCQSPPYGHSTSPQPSAVASGGHSRTPSLSSVPSPNPYGGVPHLSPLHQHPKFNYNIPPAVSYGPYAAIGSVFPEAPPSSPSHSYASSGAYAYPPTDIHANTDSAYALATMPRRKKDNKLQIQEYQRPSVRIYTGTKDDTATIPNEQVKAEVARPPRLQGLGRVKPPTPPMRRLPSWENRIYAIASAGLRLPDPAANRESCFPVTDGLYTDQMYEDLTVPVYTTLKGRAAQIRSTPFTRDSSTDSSDNEDTGVVMATTSTSSESDALISMATSDTKTSTSAGGGPRKQSNQSSSGATKRAVSSQSVSSETSSDYAVPPDEVSINTSDSSDNSEPEQKLLKYTAENFHKDSLERCGYLTKLGGKVKNWKRRWFVLKNCELLYYKTPNDVVRKPQGYITLDGQTRITKTEGALTFELTTSKRTYYLTADTKEDMDHWIRVLQNVLKKQAADRILGQSRAKEVMKGWIIKTKHGRSRRCWCVLMGKFFMYYKNPNDKTPLGQVHLRDAKIEEVDRSCDSETDSDDTSIPDYTLGILPPNQSPTYLMLPTKHEKDSWMYHLTVAAGGGSGNVGTEYEQLISKLMEVTGDAASVYWKHPLLLHTKEPIVKPLTSLPSEDLHQRAVELFRSCHMFMNLAIDSPQIDYHVSLAQNILEVCLQHSELQNEIYCQLIKQTSRHPPQHKSGVQNLLLCGSHSWFSCDASPTSPTNSLVDLSDSKLNPNNSVFVQGWQLLAMCLSLFIPKQSILWYLKAHLQRNADPRTDHGKFAVFCQRALDRTLQNGSREARPSRMEVLSILLRNPYHHSQPISIPVHFLNGTYQVVSFDGSTTVLEFVSSLNKAINMRDCALSGFCLFTDDPAGQELEHCLKTHLKLCDVISKWEQAFLHFHSGRGRPDSSRTVKLTYKNRLFFRSLSRTETEKERLLSAYQVNEDIINGRFPLNKELALELAALMAQIEYGDYRDPYELSLMVSGRLTPPHSQMQLPAIMERFFPKRYKDPNPTEMRLMEQRIAEKWAGLKGRPTKDCVRIYLTVARKWPFYGAKLFSAKIRHGSIYQVWLAVQEDCISVLDYATLKALNVYEYKCVVTFGGFKDDFMLSVNKIDSTTGKCNNHTERLIFNMTKAKILEVTMLMASYINSRGQHKNAIQARNEARDTVRKSYTASQYSTLMHTFTKVSSSMEV